MTWQLAAAMNAVIAAGYLAICATILSGLVHTRQLRTNPLAAATAAIFLTCAVHHGAHSIHMLLPTFGVDRAHGVALRDAFGWQSVAWDAIGAAVAVYYLSLRRSYGVLMRTPAMFEDEVQRRTADRVERERALLARAEELAGAGSWDADIQAGEVTWSAGMYRIRGREPREGPVSWADAAADIHPDDRDRVNAAMTAGASGDELAISYRVVTARGGIRHLESRAITERDHAGAPVRMVGVTLDVTARRETEIAREHAERELRTREQMLTGVIENSPALIYVKDLEGRYVLYNRPFAEAFGLAARAQAAGETGRNVLLGHGDEWLDPALAPVWRASDLRARRGAHRLEEWSDHPERGRRFYDSVKFPLRDGDGQLVGTCGVSLETTERRLLEAELTRSSRYFQLSRDLVCTAGLDGCFKELNEAWATTLGWSKAELRAHPFLSFVHPDDRAATTEVTAGLAAGHMASQFVNRYATKQGGWRWLEWTAMMSDGLIYASARDVTDRKRAEDRIKRSERLLADLLNTAPDAVVIADRDGQITLVNEQTERLFGYARDDLVGSPIERLLPDLVRAGPAGDREGYIAQPGPRPMGVGLDLAGRRRDGRDFPVDVSLSAVETDDGPLVTAFVRDVTDRKRTQDELVVAHQRALEASRLKSEFVANMSHEIRTPLNGVIGMGGLLLDTDLDAEQREYAEALGVSADALMAVISDILDFSKIEAGKFELDAHHFDLPELVEGVSSMLARSAHEKRLELMAWVDRDVLTSVHADAGRIRQVLVNLVTNAIKFTDRGEVMLKVTGRTGHDGSVRLRFSVSDTGIGIEPAALDHIFEAFSQADSSTTRRYGGTGLGLAICAQLVRLMGGRIGVKSERGAGSTFWFTVPVAALPQQVAPRRLDLVGNRVLVVDDNATSRTILQHALSGFELTCDTVDGAAGALLALRAAADAGTPYDLALVDQHMPGTSGLELALAVRATPALGSVRLLLLTSSGWTREGAEAAGVDGFLTKPVRASRLLAEITRVIGRRDGARPPGEPSSAPAAADDASVGGSVLVAEDHPINQLVVTRMLEKRGFRVEVAANGREAVERQARGHFDLIFMDCQMPELDGYGATAEIRRREGAAGHTPIVAMTANTLQGDRERCLAAGMDDYVGKPLRPQELDEVIARALPGQRGALAAGPLPPAPGDPAPEKAVARPPALVDLSRLADAFDGDAEGRSRLVVLFLSRSRTTIEALGDAIGAGDLAAGARLAHSLKGSAGVVGADRLAALAAEMGDTLASGRPAAVAGIQTELVRTLAMTETAFNHHPSAKVKP